MGSRPLRMKVRGGGGGAAPLGCSRYRHTGPRADVHACPGSREHRAGGQQTAQSRALAAGRLVSRMSADVTLAAPFPLIWGYERLFSLPVLFPGRWTLVESSKHPRQSDWAEQSDVRPSTGVSSPGSPVSPCTGLGVRMAWFPSE